MSGREPPGDRAVRFLMGRERRLASRFRTSVEKSSGAAPSMDRLQQLRHRDALLTMTEECEDPSGISICRQKRCAAHPILANSRVAPD